jgi:hypothetical protein
MSGEYLEKIMLLSSAVADADNHTMTHGKKLEILTALDTLLARQEKSEIIKTQKKIEDLCLRIIFQSCPNVLIPLIVSVLSQCYARGSNAALHACVAFLLQLAALSPKEKIQLDRPIPGREESQDRTVSVPERCVCFSVGAGIVVSKGPSAAYFVPNILQAAHKLLKLSDPAARESCLRNLRSVIEFVGVPGQKVGEDIFANILYKSVYNEKVPQVRIAAAHALGIFCAKSRAVVVGNCDTIQTLCLKMITTPADQMKDQGFSGPLLVEARNAFGNVIVQLILAVMGLAEKKFENSSTGTSIKHVTGFPTALTVIMAVIKKYKTTNLAGTNHFVYEALSTIAVRLAVALGEREEDLLLLAKTVVSELSLVSVSIAGRCIRRILRAGEGDSGVLRIISETLMPIIRNPTTASEVSVVVSLVGLVEAMAIVDSSIGALDSDLGSDLVQLISLSGNSTSVAMNAAFALRALCRVNPPVSFSLVNVLLNHITIQRAELEGSEKSSQHLFVRTIFNFSISLASVLCECSHELPQDVASAVISAASGLIGSAESDTILSVSEYQKKSSGFSLLIPLVGEASVLQLFSLWKETIGKRTKDVLVAAIAPGTVIQDVGPIMECFQTILVAMRSLRNYCEKRSEKLNPDSLKMVLTLLNNVWVITQSAVPLETSTVDSAPSLSLLVHAIRAELYSSLSALSDEQLESLARPFAAFLAGEVSRQESASLPYFRCSPSVIFDAKNFGFFSPEILDLCDALFESPATTEFDYALGVAVSAELNTLFLDRTVPVRDYYASGISMGTLEEFYSFFPASFGSPFCPLFPYLSCDPLNPIADQMPHPVTEARLSAVKLLPRFLCMIDRPSEEACVNVLVAGYQSIEQWSSVEFEEEKHSIVLRASPVVAAVAGVTVSLFYSENAFRLSDNSARALLSVAASPVGLGALHPMTRRMASAMIAAIYSAKPDFRDSIFQCVTDCAVSKTARTRSATALLIASLVQVSPMGSLTTMAGNLFKLAKELVQPTRSSALYALMTVCASARVAIAPYTKEIGKIATAHAVADIYPNGLASALIAGILASLAPVATPGVLWESIRKGLETHNTFSSVTERFLLQAPRSTEFVIDTIGGSIESKSAVCKAALAALTDIVSQQKSGIAIEFLDPLFSVCDLNPPLRGDVDKSLKVLVRTQGQLALRHLLSALTVVGGQSNVEENTPEEEQDYDEESVGKKAKKNVARKPVTVTSKTLMVKCVKRILKSETFVKDIADLDKLVNVAVAAAGYSNPSLSLQGMKLLLLIIELFGSSLTQKPREAVITGDESDASPASDVWEGPMPVLLEFETQILSAIRRGLKSSSDIQKLSLLCVEKILKKNLSTSPDKLIELLLQPLVLIDPATMPWSSYFVLREAGNAVVSGRSQQTSEREVSLVLFTRIAVISRLMDWVTRECNEILIKEFRKNSEFIHYFFLRLLIDCSGADAKNTFSFTENDREILRESLRDLLAPAVLNGLAVSTRQEWGKIFCPMDCPVKNEVDMISLFVGTLQRVVGEWLDNSLTCNKLEVLVKPVELVVFGYGGDKELLSVFLAEVKDRENSTEAYPEMLRLAFELITDHPDIAEEKPDIVWALTRHGISADEHSVRSVGEIVQWLLRKDFFSNNEEEIKLLVTSCLFGLVQKQPQIVLKILRDAVAEIDDESKLCELMNAMVDLFDCVEGGTVQFVVVLLLPVISRMLGSGGLSELGVANFGELRIKMLGCKNEAVMIQFMTKLMLGMSEAPFWMVRDFCLPLTLEFLARDLDESFSLLQPLVPVLSNHKDQEEWNKFVGLVVALACLEDTDEEAVGKTLISCMQASTDIFKGIISELAVEDKSKVEVLVRKYVPKREVQPPVKNEDREQSTNNPSATAPQIQLKLKFGKV